MNSVIGALRAVLGMDSTAFDKGVGAAQKQLASLNRDFQKVARDLDKLGSAMSVAITAPIVAAAGIMTKTSGDFEEGMNKVKAATGATADEMSRLTTTAKTIGRAAGFSAQEAAGAMEALAKNGLNVGQILDGAAAAAVNLAAANGAQLEPAANVVTDTMAQFGKTAAQLPGVVNQVTGTLIASKLGFDDYRLAIGQAGGVAGKLGVTFEDFNAALAATSASFASGSDAGTSFKTFLTRLAPQSDEAKDAMKALGLSFFDSKGAMVSMEEQAARLQKALKGLSDKSKIDLVTKIFGTDAMRTALSLADAGAEGIRKMRSEIEKTSAADQAAVRLEGLNGALRKLKASWESLSLAIGASGLLEAATKLAIWAGTMVDKLAALPPATLAVATSIAAVAAAAGPLLVIGGAIVSWLGQMAVWAGRLVPALAPIVAFATPWVALALAITAAAGAIVLFGDDIKVAKDGSITLNDALKGILASLEQIESSLIVRTIEGLGRAVKDLASHSVSLSNAWNAFASQDLATFAKNSIAELQAIVAAAVGAFNVIVTAWKSLGPIFEEIFENLRAATIQKFRDMAQGILDVLNWLREKVGNTPFPPLPPPQFQKENEGAMARAGKAIADAWNDAFARNFFGPATEAIAQGAITAAMNRMIGNAQLPPGVTSADFNPKAAAPAGGGTGGRDVSVPDSKSKSLAEALKRIEEEKTALDKAAAFLRSAGIASEQQLFQAADELARIGAKVADMLKGMDPDSAMAKKINADVTALEKARTAYTQLGDAIRYAFQTEAQFGNGQATHAETMRMLDAALATGKLSQDAYAAAVRAANDALADQTNKAAGAKGGLEGFMGGMRQAADELERSGRSFEVGKRAFGELQGAVTEAGKSLLRLDADVGTILGRMLQRLADFAFEVLVMKPIFDAIGAMIKGAFSGGGAGGGGGGILGSLLGGGSSGTAPGIFDSLFTATMGSPFGYAAGGRPPSGQLHWVGENGPELRKEGAGAIIPNAKSMKLAGAWYTGAQMGMAAPTAAPLSRAEQGDGGGTTIINQSLNFALGVKDTVRAEIRGMLPEIAKAGAAAAQTIRQRGGSFKESFSPR